MADSVLRFRIGDEWIQLGLTSSGRKQLSLKVQGSQQAQKAEFWRSVSIPTNYVSKLKSVTRSPFLETVSPTDQSNAEQVRGWLLAASQRALQFDQAPLDNVLGTIGTDLLDGQNHLTIYRLLKSVRGNITGSHGDLHIGNILRDKEQELMLSDFDCFQPFGFFGFDLIHFHVVEMADTHEESWVEVLNNDSNLGNLEARLSLFGFSFTAVHVLHYALLRSHLEYSVQRRKDRLSIFHKVIARSLKIALRT